MGSRETIEGGTMASYLTGSMNTFPNKLINLENRPEKIEELEHHLVKLKECFFKVAGRGKTDDQAQEWMKQVRKLFFDIEDWIEEKLETPKRKKVQQPGTNMAGPSEIEEKIKETNKVDPSEIEEKITGFITLTEEACGRCTRYKLVDEATTSGAKVPGFRPRVVTIDSRLLLEGRPYFIALERPVDVLKGYLTDDQTELKVVSIVGMGGLGKTTLAKKIHDEIQGKFQCGAFVHVGCRHPSTSAILVNILQQLACKHESERLLDEQQVIAELWTPLSEKRYLVVLDCIWSIRTWRVISCALPDNNLGSRVLITTRMKDVAKSCSPRYTDVVHQMEALSDANSKRLFEQEAKTGVDDDVLTMCGGIPLAITVAAGLSTVKYTELEEPRTLGQGILSSLGQYYSLSPEMTKILHMSYADLSVPLRSFFLYLSVFPEDYTIKKDRLIRLWFAEGFIPKVDDESYWVTGERCFNELISRRLIQPVYAYEDGQAVVQEVEVTTRRLIKPVFGYEDGQAVACTVQPVILDFIRTLSREENFATRAAELSSAGPSLCETIRRFSLDCSNEDEADIFESSTENLSCIRSLTVFGDVEEMPWAEAEDMPRAVPGVMEGAFFLLPFKLLRVLDLGDAKNLRAGHLKGIGGLILLRYLRLAPSIVHLPEEIGNLEQLETLDLRRTPSVHFSGFINNLRKLVHILFCVTASPDLPIDCLLGMTELEEVSNIDVGICESPAGLLRRIMSDSKRLRILGITLRGPRWRTTAGTARRMPFLEELWKSKFDSLSLYCREFNDDSIAGLLGSWEKAAASAAAKFEPRRFELNIYSTGNKFLGRFPPHIDSLGSLTHLHIPTEILEQKDVDILGNMERLVLLNLSSDKPSIAGRCLAKEGAFSGLLVLSVSWRQGGMGLQFQQGAMPQLRRLFLGFTVSRSWDSFGNFDFGMENIACLTRIHATINCHSATESEIETAETQARGEVSGHANKPILELCRYNFDLRNKGWESYRRTRTFT